MGRTVETITVNTQPVALLEYEGSVDDNAGQIQQDFEQIFDNFFDRLLTETANATEETDSSGIDEFRAETPGLSAQPAEAEQQQNVPETTGYEPAPFLKRKPSTKGNYTVQKGETLQKIAEKFNTTIEWLALRNNIDSLNRGNIYVGEKLFVPEVRKNPQEEVIFGRVFEFSNNFRPVPYVGSDHFEQFQRNFNEKNRISRNEVEKTQNIRYINSDGNKPKSVRSRIQYDGQGVFSVNLSSLNEATRNNYNLAVLDSNNWTYNSQTGKQDIGISRKVAEIQLQYTPFTARPDYTPVGVEQEHTTTRTVGENAKSTGQPDRRVGRDINTVGSGAATQGGAIFMLALDAFFIGYDWWATYSVEQDRNAIDRDKQSLKRAFKLVDEIQTWDINGTTIPYKYRNVNDLGAITNFIFQGENNTGNRDITNIGIEVIKLSKHYEKTKKITPAREW